MGDLLPTQKLENKIQAQLEEERRARDALNAEQKRINSTDRASVESDLAAKLAHRLRLNEEAPPASLERAKPPPPEAKPSPPAKRNEIAEAAGQEAASWL